MNEITYAFELSHFDLNSFLIGVSCTITAYFIVLGIRNLLRFVEKVNYVFEDKERKRLLYKELKKSNKREEYY